MLQQGLDGRLVEVWRVIGGDLESNGLYIMRLVTGESKDLQSLAELEKVSLWH